jgi:SRSO17 transposase
MRETTPAAMPPCFGKWCKGFDPDFKTQAQKKGFRHYLGGLLGESERKNITQMANDSVGVVYKRLHHFITESPWEEKRINERRLAVMDCCHQTRVGRGFALLLDDTGHRKSGNFTAGVGRQYIGEIGKLDNGIVAVTTHLYDGQKNLPLDVEIYQPASSLPSGQKAPSFKKKPEIALELIDRSLNRGYRPGIVLMDAGYGNNTNLLKGLESRRLKYLGAVAKNRTIWLKKSGENRQKIRLDEYAKSLSEEDFRSVSLNLDQPKILWVATGTAELSRLQGERTFAIVMNASSYADATEIDYSISNEDSEKVTAEWVANTYSKRNWIEVFYREAKGWLGWRECQARGLKSLHRHFILLFCAYTFILWQKLTGGLRRKWANKPLETFVEALEAFRTAISFRFVEWLTFNRDLFAAYKARLGFIWG